MAVVIAFDANRGRLWVVCGRCQRWNLSPIEERWEAVEACERAFRSTILRVSTDNIGLARTPDGLDLIRIGEPLRPEFAAWRYGREFRQRRIRALTATISIAGGATGIVLNAPLVAAAVFIWPAHVLLSNRRGQSKSATPARIISNMGEALDISSLDWGSPRLREGGGHADAWQLEVEHGPYVRRSDAPLEVGFNPALWPHRHGLRGQFLPRRTAILTGREAEHALAILLPRINPLGAGRRRIARAVSAIEDARGPHRYFAKAETCARELGLEDRSIAALPLEIRLALEIAANEETERRAMAGELELLERAWREAEEIASLADDLALPSPLRERLGGPIIRD